MKELTVIARSQAIKGKEAELEKALRAVVGPAHKEKGCLRYAIHRGAENPSLFVVVERWDSMESLTAHLESDHVQKLFKEAATLVASAPEIVTYELLKEGNEQKGSL